MTSLASPVMFSTIPQILVNVCPRNIRGSRVGILACTHGMGRLLATVIVGPLFQVNPAIVYNIVAMNGAACAFVFYLLYRSVRQQGIKLNITQEPFLKESGQSSRISTPSLDGYLTLPIRREFSLPATIAETAAALLVAADD